MLLGDDDTNKLEEDSLALFVFNQVSYEWFNPIDDVVVAELGLVSKLLWFIDMFAAFDAVVINPCGLSAALKTKIEKQLVNDLHYNSEVNESLNDLWA